MMPDTTQHVSGFSAGRWRKCVRASVLSPVPSEGLAPASDKIPERIKWAVALLDAQPRDRILEVGCGTGVAVSEVCRRLDGGRITAIDLSATAIAKARARNKAQLAAGRAQLERVALSDFDGAPNRFDKAFAVNVNVFWTRAADDECALLRRVLRPRGVLRLVFDQDPSGRGRDLGAMIVPQLKAHGFTCRVTRHPAGSLVCVTGRRRG
jgi:SAM-dependent methyltransferase